MTVGNSVTLIGNLGNDFEVKELGNGQTLAKTSLATNQNYKDKQGEYVKKTQWHNIIVWGSKAKAISKSTKKGSKLAITGSIQYDSYEDKEGIKRKSTQIVVTDFDFLDKKSESVEAAPF